MKPIRLVVKLVNNHLRERREAMGLSQELLAQQIGITLGGYAALETMRDKPVKKNGDWRRVAICVAEFHGVAPDELFPEVVLGVERNTVERKLDATEVLSLLPAASESFAAGPEVMLLAASSSERMSAAIEGALATLTDNEAAVLRRRYLGCEELGPTAIGKELELSKERIRQIEARALRKLRYPSRSKSLKEFF